MTQIQWGILGTSQISEVLAKAIQESSNAKLTAIGSRTLANAKKFADQFSIKKLYTDYQALLNDPEVQAVYIGLPNHLHKEWTIRAAEAGKHILCEKPFVLDANEAQEAIAAVQKAGVFCMEALMYRSHPFITKLQEVITSKMIGEVKLYNATYTANIASFANPTAGGSIRNLGCYPISLVRLLAQSEPIEIQSLGRSNSINKNDSQASTILRFSDQSMAVVSTADDIDMSWQLDIYGAEGHLKVISNPWLPEKDNNKMIIYRKKQTYPVEINVTAEKSLYVYQVELASENILKKNFNQHKGISLEDSLGNVRVLEEWRKQITT